MFLPQVMEELVAAHQADLRRRADQHRLAALARGGPNGHRGIVARVLHRLQTPLHTRQRADDQVLDLREPVVDVTSRRDAVSRGHATSGFRPPSTPPHA